MTRIGRNDPCHCGSGKKYKHCCLNRDRVHESTMQPPHLTPVESSEQSDAFQFPGVADSAGFDDEEWELDDLPDDELEEVEELLTSSPLYYERVLWELQRLLASELIPEGADPDEVLNEWMERDEFPDVPFATPVDEAQAMMYDAWMSGDPEQEIAMAHQALEISEDCADACLTLGDLEAEDDDQAREWYRRAVEAGERALGLDVLGDEDLPDLTGTISAYPYFRASINYALSLMELEQHEDAIMYLERVLRLDTVDSQGVRYTLLGEYLRQRNHKAARKLTRRFEQENSAAWPYARALLAFQEQGDSRNARRYLSEAVKKNPYLGACLTSLRLMLYGEPQPFAKDYMPKLDGFFNARSQAAAWAETPGALDWLMQYLNGRA